MDLIDYPMLGIFSTIISSRIFSVPYFFPSLFFFFLQVKPFISPLVRPFEWSSDEACKVKVKSLSRVRLFATPWTIAYQVPPSMGFSRQEYWSGLSFPSPYFFPSFSGTPINRMLVHLILSQRSLRLSSILFIPFPLFCSSEVISTILSFSSLIRSSVSVILLLVPLEYF